MMNATQAICCTRSCAAALREDGRSGLIYGPYAMQLTDMPKVTCTVCGGKGSYASYADDPINGNKAGKPAPCEFCKGEGSKYQIKYLNRVQWACHSNQCVYCGSALPKGRTAYLKRRFNL